MFETPRTELNRGGIQRVGSELWLQCYFFLSVTARRVGFLAPLAY